MYVVKGLHLYGAYIPLASALQLLPHIHIHSFIHSHIQQRCQPCKLRASSSGAVRVRCLHTYKVSRFSNHVSHLEATTFQFAGNLLYLLSQCLCRVCASGHMYKYISKPCVSTRQVFNPQRPSDKICCASAITLMYTP